MTVHDLHDRHDHERGLELAALAVDFELSRAETTELETLLTGCPTCARRAAAMRTDALALSRPLTILPSPRVDAAVHAEIAGRRTRPQRLVLVAAAALLILALLGAAAIGAALLRNRETLPTTVIPTPTDPLALTSPRPETSPPAGPTAAPSPSGPAPSAIDPVVLLRVNVSSDTGSDRYPSLTVYRDGTVLSRGGEMTRLTPAGVELLLAPAIASDLLLTSGDIGPDPSYVGGGASFSIELRRGEVIVHRSSIHSAAVSPAQRTEADRIIALAELLDDHESWLPASAWASGLTAATRYIPARFLLVTTFEDGPGRRDLALDVADVDWPLPGRLEDFGEAVAEPAPGVAGSDWRCGPVTLAESLAVQRALAAAPPRSEGENVDFDLDWVAAGRHVTLSLVPLLPDDSPGCEAAGYAS